MIRYSIIIFFILFLANSCIAQKSKSKKKVDKEFYINVYIKETANGKVWVRYINADGHLVIDSNKIINHCFFKGKVNCFCYCTLILKKDEQSISTITLRFGLENKVINVTILNDSTNEITGNSTEQVIDNFYKINDFEFSNVTDKFKNDSILLNKRMAQYKSAIKSYCILNSKSNAAPFILLDNHNIFNTKECAQILKSISIRQQNSYYGILSKRRIADRNLVAQQIGITVNNFIVADYKNEPVNLFEYTSKGVVLLDFWASWCSPCRASHPSLRNLYAKYSPQGFNIISVSCDKPQDKDKWISAIMSDSLTLWPQISTLPPSGNKLLNTIDLLTDYKISAFPTGILIGRKNKIISRIENIEALEKKLNEIYGK